MGEMEELSGGIAAAVMALVAWNNNAMSWLSGGSQSDDIQRTWIQAFLLRRELGDVMIKPRLVRRRPTRDLV